MAPGGSRPTEPPEAIQAEFVLELPPATTSALPGFGGVTGKWARSMSAAGNVPFDLWQSAQVESSGSGPAGCARPVPLMFVCVRPAALSFSVRPVAVAKSMPSWQAPQASAVGLVFQLSPSLVLVVRETVLEPSWHDVQLRMSCG